MKRLSFDQRRSLGEFCGNFAVAWLAAGIIPVFLTDRVTVEVIKQSALSVVLAGILLTVMLFLTKGGKK